MSPRLRHWSVVSASTDRLYFQRTRSAQFSRRGTGIRTMNTDRRPACAPAAEKLTRQSELLRGIRGPNTPSVPGGGGHASAPSLSDTSLIVLWLLVTYHMVPAATLCDAGRTEQQLLSPPSLERTRIDLKWVSAPL